MKLTPYSLTLSLIGLIGLIAGIPASAAEKPSTIDFTQPVLDLDGKPMLRPEVNDPKKTTPITLTDIAVQALLSVTESDKNMTGAQKFDLAELAHKIYKNKTAALTIDERKLLKDRIGLVETPLVVGAVWPMLDENADKKEK